MSIRLYVVHNSHPCTAVARALELKNLPYRLIEWPPPFQALVQRAIFPERTLPAITFNGEKIQGSRAIFRRLDQLQPTPALYPADAAERDRVQAADAWGDPFQQVARDLLWAGMVSHPDALVGFSTGSKLPLPAAAVKLLAPGIARAECLANHTDAARARQRLAELPAQIAQIDAWIAQRTIGDLEHPNAADLQIFSTVRLLNTVKDAKALFIAAGSPAPDLADRLFGGPLQAELPAGAF